MFDIGFLELLLCSVIALLVLGPERLPVAARAAGRWISKARRMTRNFTSELDRQLKADELREKIRKEGSNLGAEDIQRNFQEGLAQARKYTDYLANDNPASTDRSSPSPDRAENPDRPGTAEPGVATTNTTTATTPRDEKSQEAQRR